MIIGSRNDVVADLSAADNTNPDCLNRSGSVADL